MPQKSQRHCSKLSTLAAVVLNTVQTVVLASTKKATCVAYSVVPRLWSQCPK